MVVTYYFGIIFFLHAVQEYFLTMGLLKRNDKTELHVSFDQEVAKGFPNDMKKKILFIESNTSK